jgi:protein O-mannosyl-transferase
MANGAGNPSAVFSAKDLSVDFYRTGRNWNLSSDKPNKMVLPEHDYGAILKSGFARTFSNPVFICLFLVALALITFWPATRYDFVNYDDSDYFTANPYVLSGLTSANSVWAFTTGHASNWHPLTWLSLMLDADLFGKNPAGPHFTNLVFHASNTALLFLLFWKLTAAVWRSAFVAALFALHPLHVESVAWIAERKDVLSTFFALLALLSYAHYAKENCRRSFGFALAFFALGLMAKPMLVTLPFVMLLLDWWPLQRISNPGFQTSNLRRLIFEKTPFFLLTIISCVITFVVQQKGGAVAALAKISLAERIENAFVSYARYLGKTFWPHALASPYPHPGHWEMSLVIFSAALVIGLSAIAVLFARRFPFVFTGWFWFVGTLIPVIGLVQVGNQAMADRYTYLPLIGIFIIFACGLNELCVNWRLPRLAAAFLAAIILFAASLQTRSQLAYWQNSGTLFRHTLAVTENNFVAWTDLGTYLSSQGQLPEAMDCFQKSLQINPDSADTLYNFGNALTRLGRLDEAMNNYRRALAIDPDRADALANLGFALSAKKQFTDAVSCFEQALKLDPDSAAAHNNLATALFTEHRFGDAAQHYRAAIRLAPDNPQIYANLGDTLVRLGQPAEAVQNYETVLRLNPDDARTRAKLQALGVQTSN